MREILANPKYREAQLHAGSIPAESEGAINFGRYVLAEQARLAPILANVKAE
jgi:hypothetical protein